MPGASVPKKFGGLVQFDQVLAERFIESGPELPMVANTKRFVCYVFYQPFEFFARLDNMRQHAGWRDFGNTENVLKRTVKI